MFISKEPKIAVAVNRFCVVVNKIVAAVVKICAAVNEIAVVRFVLLLTK